MENFCSEKKLLVLQPWICCDSNGEFVQTDVNAIPHVCQAIRLCAGVKNLNTKANPTSQCTLEDTQQQIKAIHSVSLNNLNV